MNHLLLERSTGSLGPQAFTRIQSTQRLHAIQPAPGIRFHGGEKEEQLEDADDRSEVLQIDAANESKLWSHQSGVNALAIDRFEGRILISGGADASIKLWNLNECSGSTWIHTLRPSGIVRRNTASHKYGITHLTFYPFDSAAFLSSSYDHQLKLYSTEDLAASASFDLDSIIYNHALSSIAHHLLVACATQHPAVRLVDLRSGASSHYLAGHHGAVLSVAWSPTVEHILASGGIDGTVRLWDIRKSSGPVGLLDMEDSIGVSITGNLGTRSHGSRDASKAHIGAVNGITWTDDGSFIATSGHDERIRVWDTSTGANTLASFGPTLKNSHLSSLPLLIPPTSLSPPTKEVLFYPNEREILMFELHEGKILKRLKVPGPNIASVRSRTGERNIKNRTTALAWRMPVEGVYSAHSDGQIRAWLPRTSEDERLDREEEAPEGRSEDETEGVKRKRKVLDDVFRDLTRQKITFG